MTFMLMDENGNALDLMESRVQTHVFLRIYPDCVAVEYDDATGATLDYWSFNNIPPFTVELTHTTADARLA